MLNLNSLGIEGNRIVLVKIESPIGKPLLKKKDPVSGKRITREVVKLAEPITVGIVIKKYYKRENASSEKKIDGSVSSVQKIEALEGEKYYRIETRNCISSQL